MYSKIISDPLPWASGNSEAVQWQSSVPWTSSVHWNATREKIGGSQCVSSVFLVCFQWSYNGVPVYSNYVN